MRITFIAFCLVASIGVYSQTVTEGGVEGCSCGVLWDTVIEEFNHSDQVYAGKVIGLSEDKKSIVIEVIRAWKGVTTKSVKVRFIPDDPCRHNYPFIVGQNYIIYSSAGLTCSTRIKELLRSVTDIQQFPNAPTFINDEYGSRFPPEY